MDSINNIIHDPLPKIDVSLIPEISVNTRNIFKKISIGVPDCLTSLKGKCVELFEMKAKLVELKENEVKDKIFVFIRLIVTVAIIAGGAFGIVSVMGMGAHIVLPVILLTLFAYYGISCYNADKVDALSPAIAFAAGPIFPLYEFVRPLVLPSYIHDLEQEIRVDLSKVDTYIENEHEKLSKILKKLTNIRKIKANVSQHEAKQNHLVNEFKYSKCIEALKELEYAKFYLNAIKRNYNANCSNNNQGETKHLSSPEFIVNTAESLNAQG